MAFDSKGLDDYIDVAQRIAEFRTKHPEGSLQPLNPAQPFEIRELAGTDKNGKEQRGTFIIYTAAAYRSPDDPRPGVGCAYEVFPGRTPYTAGSELQNAETAAWGRAIVAVLAADTRAGIASQQEVRNRQAERGNAAGEAFENAAPARPANQGPRSVEAADPDAQKYADEAHNASTPQDIADIHRRAREEGKLTALVHNPAKSAGKPGKLALYLDWKRTQVKKAAAPDLPDEWRDKIADILDGDAADAVIAEATQMLGDGKLDTDLYARIALAVEARLAELGEARAAA